MTPSLGTSKIKRTGSFLLLYRRAVAHWRAIILLLILARVAFLVASSDEFVSFELNLFALLLIFIASQIFWIGRIVDLGKWLFPDQPRVRLVVIANLVYLFVIAYSFPTTIGQGHTFRTAYYGLSNVVFEAVFWWWFVGSMLAFALVVFFGTVERTTRVAAWAYRKARQSTKGRVAAASSGVADPVSPDRRHFLEQTAVLISATPFIAAGYGLLYERQNVEIVRQRIRLARLPKAFEGFHIAQLSDIHISPFTTADYLRRCVAITNGLRPDLIALTGDYVCWDPEAQDEVVAVLAGLRAPHGVFGCLGNHEADVEIEASITHLFAAHGIRILRQERAPIRLRDDVLNLIGIDDGGGVAPADVLQAAGQRRLQQLKALVMPNT